MEDRFLVRYWVKDSKKYLNSNKLVYNDGTYTQVSTKQLPNGKYISYIIYDWNTSEVIPEQCTGLKDKNGKLIYEGDIVKSTVYTVNMKVVYCIEETFFGLKYSHNDDNRCSAAMPSSEEIEVIGNIHENADLLGEK